MKSFTLIEIVIAIFIITVGTVGAFTMIQRVLSFTSLTTLQLQAAYLAQEGIENIRNVRDGNWLEQRSGFETAWDEGINSGDWQQVYFLDGSPSKFQRKIGIARPEADKMTVSVQIKWSERGVTHEVVVQTELRNWY